MSWHFSFIYFFKFSSLTADYQCSAKLLFFFKGKEYRIDLNQTEKFKNKKPSGWTVL